MKNKRKKRGRKVNDGGIKRVKEEENEGGSEEGRTQTTKERSEGGRNMRKGGRKDERKE